VFLLAASPTETVAAAAKSPPAQRLGSATRHRTIAAHTGSRRLRRPPGGVVWARNAILLDPYTDSVLYEKNSETPAPIASLTKLMTVMVFLEQNPDLRRPVVVTRDELHGAGHTQLRNLEVVPLYDLLHMSLMCSDNVATRVLARESGLTADEFVGRMNRKAKDLGLEQTRFVEPTGLDERNVSTAADVARLLRDDHSYIYICGLKGMEAGVDEAFRDVCDRDGLNWDALLPRLRASGRYHVETY